MQDFWTSSGHVLLDHDASGRLLVTDEFLKAYLARPEIVPPAEACVVERAVHARLLRAPREAVADAEVADIADRDARENWRHFLAFRNHLVASGTIERAYVGLFKAGRVTTPLLFVNQLTQLVARNMLDGETDAFKLRAAELLYRAQRLSVRDGVPLLADEELIGDSTTAHHYTPLTAVFADARSRDLDVLTTDNAAAYFERSDAFDMVLDFRHGGPGRAGFAGVLERFVAHTAGAEVKIEPLERLDGAEWKWFVGLDQDATAIGNALWRGEEPPEAGRDRIVALFRLTFADKGDMLERVAGHPVFLILAMSPNRVMRVKPQNLLTGLPLRVADAASVS
jgi:hypothetical protein